VADSRRGLTILPYSLDAAGPIHLVEGASDALAMHSVGALAVGRPGARATANVKAWTVQLLTRVLKRSPDHEVIVVGDRDTAGLDGARALAEFLEDRLDRRIKVALPRPPHKDVRDQIIAGDWANGLNLHKRPSKKSREMPDLIRRAFDRAVRSKVTKLNHSR
jgi:hypothetical protein